MDPKGLEDYKRSLEAELERGIQILRAAHKLQLNAIETIQETIQRGGLGLDALSVTANTPKAKALPAAPLSPPVREPTLQHKVGKPKRRVHRSYGRLRKAIEHSIEGVAGRRFTLDDVLKGIGKDANRGSVRSTVNRLASIPGSGFKIAQSGSPTEPTVYEKDVAG